MITSEAHTSVSIKNSPVVIICFNAFDDHDLFYLEKADQYFYIIHIYFKVISMFWCITHMTAISMVTSTVWLVSFL